MKLKTRGLAQGVDDRVINDLFSATHWKRRTYLLCSLLLMFVPLVVALLVIDFNSLKVLCTRFQS